MCSTFKALAAAAALKRVDAGLDRLDRRDRLRPGRPARTTRRSAKARLGEGGDEASPRSAPRRLQWSDNTAANLLLKAIGGPPGGHRTSRARSAIPSPASTATSRRSTRPFPAIRATRPDPAPDGGQLARPSYSATRCRRRRAVSSKGGWTGDKVGDKRLRAGLPADWAIADKTGTVVCTAPPTRSPFCARPARPPLFVAVYFWPKIGPTRPDERNAVHRDVARVIVETM